MKYKTYNTDHLLVARQSFLSRPQNINEFIQYK